MRPFLTLRSSCASSQILPIVTSSRRPGVAAARYVKIFDRNKRSRIARTFSWRSTYSRIDSSGSIEMAQRFSAISTSENPTEAR